MTWKCVAFETQVIPVSFKEQSSAQEEGLVINRILSRVGGNVWSTERRHCLSFLWETLLLWGGQDLPGRRSFGTRLCNKITFLVGSFKLHKAQQETVQASFHLFVFMKTDNIQAQANTFQIDVNQALKVKSGSLLPTPALLGINTCLLHFRNTLYKVTHTRVYPLSVSTVEGSPFLQIVSCFISTSVTEFWSPFSYKTYVLFNRITVYDIDKP